MTHTKSDYTSVKTTLFTKLQTEMEREILGNTMKIQTKNISDKLRFKALSPGLPNSTARKFFDRLERVKPKDSFGTSKKSSDLSPQYKINTLQIDIFNSFRNKKSSISNIIKEETAPYESLNKEREKSKISIDNLSSNESLSRDNTKHNSTTNQSRYRTLTRKIKTQYNTKRSSLPTRRKFKPCTPSYTTPLVKQLHLKQKLVKNLTDNITYCHSVPFKTLINPKR